MALVLLCALFVPVTMAKENEKAVLAEMKMPVVDTSKMSSLDEEDLAEVEELVYMFLKMDNISVSNFDLSNIKIQEDGTNFIMAGIMSCVEINDSKVKVYDIYTNIDFENQSFQIISKSKNDYLNVMISQIFESDDLITYNVESTLIENGIIQKSNEYISQQKDVNSLKQSVNLDKEDNVKLLYATQYVFKKFNLPSNPPRFSVLLKKDIKLSNLLSAASVITILSGVFSGGLTTAVALVIVGLALEIVNIFFNNFSDVNTSDIYTSLYGMVSWFMYHPGSGVYGMSVSMPTGFVTPGIYLEITHYYKYVPV
ncbi:hypothetical protein [Methanolapillus ohkumae]